MTNREGRPEDPAAQDARELELLEVLRAADPAADVETSPGFVATVMARIAADTVGDDGTDPNGADPELDGASPAAPIDLAAQRAARTERGGAGTRRRRWQPLLAGAAAAAVVGVAGFSAGALVAGGGLAATSASDSAAESSDASEESAYRDESEPQALPESVFPGPIDLGGGQSGLAWSSGGADGATGDAASRLMYSGRHDFVGSGFATTAGTGTLYGLDPSGADEATVRELADLFGVEGEPRLEWGAWHVGSQSGDGPAVTVSLDGSASFSFQNWAIDPMQTCWSIYVVGDDPDDQDWVAYERQVQECQANADAAAPAADLARAELERVLAGVGLDPADFELSARRDAGTGQAQAEAVRIVDGQRTDLIVSLSLGPDGTTSVWGTLADVVALRDVALVSEAAAVERLSDPRFGAVNLVMPYAAQGYVEGDGEYVEPTAAPAAPGADARIEWPVWRVELVSVRLGLGQQYQSDGSVLLVPAYEFTDADGGTWSVIAVADADLTFDQGG